MELNENLLNIMPNISIKQAYVQGFDCKYITFKNAVNIFERMGIAKYIYEVVVEPSYLKTTRAYANRYGHRKLKR